MSILNFFSRSKSTALVTTKEEGYSEVWPDKGPEKPKYPVALLCIDCRHVMKDHSSPEYSKCGHVNSAIANTNSLVAGPLHRYCSTERGYGEVCGYKGNLWEPKQLKRNGT